MPLVANQIATGPAQAPQRADFECAKRVLVSLRIQDAHAAAWLGDKSLKVKVGTTGEVTHATDSNGYFTLIYDGDGDLPADDVAVVWDENKRSGKKKINAATLQSTLFDGRLRIYSLTIPVAGTFTLEIDIKAWRPWKTATDFAGQHVELKGAQAKLDWQEPPGTAKTLNALIKAANSDAYQTFSKADLPCGTDVTITCVIPGSAGYLSWVKVGDSDTYTAAKSTAATADGVTFTSDDAASRVVVNAANHGTRVRVFIGHEFKKVFIAGEGTSFDYAVGLAEVFQSMSPTGTGVLWVYASQYDVTPVGNLSTRRDAMNPATGAAQRAINQRTRVAAAMAINLFIVKTTTADDAGNVGRFDVTDAAHWAALTQSHATFDATIFNNPHPGYGVHAAIVFGLTANERRDGRYVIVHTIRYNIPAVAAVSDAAWDTLLQHITGKRFDVQQPFVRGLGATSLGYANRPSATLPTWNLDGTLANKSIDEAFEYTDGSAIGADPEQTTSYYGGATEFRNHWTDHYQPKITTVGLHAHVIRSYRRRAPSVLKTGGRVLIHGSQSYAGDLTAEVKKEDGNTVLAEAMIDNQLWSDNDYFVHYPTNFTSSRFHPSHFQSGYHPKHEPSLRSARQYSWTKT